MSLFLCFSLHDYWCQLCHHAILLTLKFAGIEKSEIYVELRGRVAGCGVSQFLLCMDGAFLGLMFGAGEISSL